MIWIFFFQITFQLRIKGEKNSTQTVQIQLKKKKAENNVPESISTIAETIKLALARTTILFQFSSSINSLVLISPSFEDTSTWPSISRVAVSCDLWNRYATKTAKRRETEAHSFPSQEIGFVVLQNVSSSCMFLRVHCYTVVTRYHNQMANFCTFVRNLYEIYETTNDLLLARR